MQIYHKKFEVTWWEGIKSGEAFDDRIIRWEFQIYCATTIFFDSNKLHTPVHTTENSKAKH